MTGVKCTTCGEDGANVVDKMCATCFAKVAVLALAERRRQWSSTGTRCRPSRDGCGWPEGDNGRQAQRVVCVGLDGTNELIHSHTFENDLYTCI